MEKFINFNQLKTNLEKVISSPLVINISKVYVGDILSKIFMVGTTLLLIRGLSKTDYAFYTAFISIGSLLSSLIGNGINNAMVRFSADHLSRTGKKPYTIYILSITIQMFFFILILLLVVFFSNDLVRLFLGNMKYSKVIAVGSLFGLGRLMFGIGRSILQAEERFNHFVGTLWLQNGLIFIFIFFLWLSRNLEFLNVAWSLASIQIFAGGGIILFSVLGLLNNDWARNLTNEKNLIREFFVASGFLIAYYFFQAAFSRMDILMLSRFATDEQLANYGVAFKYYSMFLLLLASVNAVLRPKFSRVEMQIEDRQILFLKKWLKYSVWFVIPVILFIIWGKPIYIFVNGVQYTDSFAVMRVFSIGFWLSIMLSPLVNIIISRKEFRFLFLTAVIAFFVNIITTYFGVQYLGGVGAAVAVVLAHNFVIQLPILWKILK